MRSVYINGTHVGEVNGCCGFITSYEYATRECVIKIDATYINKDLTEADVFKYIEFLNKMGFECSVEKLGDTYEFKFGKTAFYKGYNPYYSRMTGFATFTLIRYLFNTHSLNNGIVRRFLDLRAKHLRLKVYDIKEPEYLWRLLCLATIVRTELSGTYCIVSLGKQHYLSTGHPSNEAACKFNSLQVFLEKIKTGTNLNNSLSSYYSTNMGGNSTRCKYQDKDVHPNKLIELLESKEIKLGQKFKILF